MEESTSKEANCRKEERNWIIAAVVGCVRRYGCQNTSKELIGEGASM